jgi:hypothetical protein
MVQVALRAFPQWMTVFVKSDNFGPYEYIIEDFNVIQRVRFHSTPNPNQNFSFPALEINMKSILGLQLMKMQVLLSLVVVFQ